MGDFDFVEYRLCFKQSLNLPISASDELYPIMYSDWLYKVFESGWQRLFGEEFPYADIRISSGFPFYKEDSQILFYMPENNEYVSVVRDALTTGELKYAPGCWRFFARSRAEFNKATARHEKRYTTVELHFKEDAGIWFGARFKNHSIREKFESVIRFIGDEGIGGGRTSGYGAFKLDGINEVSMYKEEQAVFLSLSRFTMPKDINTEELFVEIRPMIVALKASESDKRTHYPIFGEGSMLDAAAKLNFLEFGGFIGENSENSKEYSKRAAFLFAMPIPAKMCDPQKN